MTVVELERALTEFFADALELAVDAGIFRGRLPHGVETGVTVFLDGMEAFSDFRDPEFIVQVLGKFDDRDEAWALLDRLAKVAPRYGIALGDERLAYLLPYGSGAPYTSADGGKTRYFASFNFRAALQASR